MKGLFYVCLIVIFSLCYSTKLKTKCECVKLLGPCDGTKICCEDLQCRDYRCAIKGAKDNLLPWAPDGIKCDWFHHCKKGLKCELNRCIPDVGAVIDAITK